MPDRQRKAPLAVAAASGGLETKIDGSEYTLPEAKIQEWCTIADAATNALSNIARRCIAHHLRHSNFAEADAIRESAELGWTELVGVDLAA